MLSDVEMFIWFGLIGSLLLSLFLLFMVLRVSTSPHKLRNGILSLIGSNAFYLVWFFIVTLMINAGGGSIAYMLLLPVGYLGFILLCWALKLGKL